MAGLRKGMDESGKRLAHQIVQGFTHGRMGEDEIPQEGVRLFQFHRHGDDVDDFGGIHVEESGAEYFSRFFALLGRLAHC